jgi:DNA polymerase
MNYRHAVDLTPAMRLAELCEQAQSCVACDLSRRRRNVVFGEGDPESPLVLIGEGPGDTEDATGRPFVGKAGQLLDRALSDAGLQRAQVYICNIVKCRACDWIEGRPVNRAPTEAEVRACSRWLEPQLATLLPKVVLCVGGPSAKALIKPDFRITKERGKYFPCRYAKVALATLHPAYILRQQSSSHDGGYSLLVADIARAWSAAQRLLEARTTEPDVRTAHREPSLQGLLFEVTPGVP